MQATSSSAAIVAAAEAASSPTTRRAPADEPAPTASTPPVAGKTGAAADLSLFLEPSFDASAYVSSLLRDVDANYKPSSNNVSDPPAASKHLHVTPASPTTRKSITLSPMPHPSADGGKDDAGSRKREQAQEDLDLSLAISRLNLAIEELDRSISAQVDAHAPELLRRTGNLALMQTGVMETGKGVQSLDEQVQGLRGKVHEPHKRLVELQAELKMVDGASGLVRRARGVVGLGRRLEVQMEALFGGKGEGKEREVEGEDAVVGQVHGRDLARAALLVAEITSLLDAEPSFQEDAKETSLHDLKLIQDLLPTITTARQTIVDYMEDMIVRGLRDLSPLMLGSSLQTAFNLRILPTLVQDLLNDLIQVVKERTAAAFDLDTLSRQLQLPIPTLDPPTTTYSTYRSGRRSIGNTDDELKQQHAHHQQVWAEAVWKKLEALIVVEMGAVCSKVYLLEKVLKLKSDAETGVNFLAAALEVLGDKPSYTFWLTFAQSLREQVAKATGQSAWLAQLLGGGMKVGEGGWPRLVRLFQEFFGKISLYTDVQYSVAHQSAETVILLKSMSGLETAYVEKSTAKIGELLGHVGSQPGSRRSSVGEEEAEIVVRSIANVLDATRFDPLLERAVVARCIGLIDQYVTRLDGAVAKEEAAWTLTSNTDAPAPTQTWNANLLQFAYTLSKGLSGVAADQFASIPSTAAPTTTAVVVHAAPATTNLAATQLSASASSILALTRTSLLQPLLTSIDTTLTSTMAKMHAQLSSTHAADKQKRGVSIDSTTGASGYATSICDALSHLRDRLLPLYPLELRTAIASVVARWVVELFCLHASIVSLPTAEEGDKVKLRMATDMTEFEFALTQMLGDQPAARLTRSTWLPEEKERELVRDEERMKTIKAFRRLLFLSLDEVEQEVKSGQGLGLPTLLVALHVLSRTSVVLEGVLQRALVKAVGKKGKSQNIKSDFVGWVRTTTQTEVGEGLQAALPADGELDDQTNRILRSLFATS